MYYYFYNGMNIMIITDNKLIKRIFSFILKLSNITNRFK